MMNTQNLTSLIQQFPLDEYLRAHSIDFVEKSRYLILHRCINPACNKENKFIINNRDKYFRCFVCDYSGNLINFISLLDDISKADAIGIIKNQTIFTPSVILEGLSKPKTNSSLDNSVLDTPTINIPFYWQKINFENHTDATNYLKNVRGYTQELVDLFALYYNEHEKRIIFPIHDHLSRLVGWQGRDITGQNPIKILTRPEGLRKSTILYNFNNVRDESMITLVEGPVDCHKSYQCNATALLGKQISDFQLSLLMTNDNLQRVNIGLDPDAKHEICKLSARLSLLYDVYIVDLPNGKDLGECSIDEANSYIDNAIPYSQYMKALSSNLGNTYS